MPAGSQLVQSSSDAPSARHFSINAAHRFSHLDCHCAVLYLGPNLDTCLFERFGGRSV
jgi:hypothetical protein